ncbi:secondary thiamine-phosphate synthase enzyme YjbQ [Mesonia aestuariivivens]|uniref:Secondary thiamine-phosphate synthase enzyme YjbQ n=1 Tax=Mesonia aestuariivivens TaxID=2796128 RepID=A0ABS6W2C6_9FLAO|nr:secondary thiamine-phosphate synthase enzyme YjbQ [Mesonia aestuariivivens]MBW2962007.1 secondary thiamine-phosphate synthase enzyme YjbQ [Mesonia aestuariivivens]
MKIVQKEIQISAKSRGFHLVSSEVIKQLPELKDFNLGTLKVFIKHTSAGLTINENADPTVREDFETHINKMVPENMPYYKHTLEGSDDMPAHIKSSLIGSSIEIPVTNGKLNLGTWQGIYLGEFRNHASKRKLVLTLMGE